MHVLIYPADQYGCGHHRLIWPGEALQRQGHQVTVVQPKDRHVMMVVDDRQNVVKDVKLPEGTDVVVLQRPTHRYLAQTVSIIRDKGIAVVVDVDDDLSTIHPANPAWQGLHPRHLGKYVAGQPYMHSWHFMAEACRDATLVTATTPALLQRYAAHRRGVVLPNYLAQHYYDVTHQDHGVIGWPAALHSHPDDPGALGNAVARLVDEGAQFHVLSKKAGVGRAFGLAHEDQLTGVESSIDLLDWPRELAQQIGIGVVPLTDTKFNAAKSWLKPLELAAAGVPWVASPRVEYTRLHQLGCGVLADKPKVWYRWLRRLLDSDSLRKELSEAGLAVAAQLKLEDHAWKWWEAWENALHIERN